jgi:hypothetical protein
VEEILGMKNGERGQMIIVYVADVSSVPVILVLTKFDAVLSEMLFDIARSDVLQYERARVKAHAIYEDALRRRFDKDPRDVPAEIVSGIYPLSLCAT